MDTDRDLLFGVLALQADLLTPAQFAEACSAWAGRKDTRLAELLQERGWLTAGDRSDVEKLLQRKLARHGGDAKAGLAEVTTDQVRQSLAGPTPSPQGHVLLATTAYVPQAGSRHRLFTMPAGSVSGEAQGLQPLGLFRALVWLAGPPGPRPATRRRKCTLAPTCWLTTPSKSSPIRKEPWSSTCPPQVSLPAMTRVLSNLNTPLLATAPSIREKGDAPHRGGVHQ
jgi:hypothetical protein